MAPESIQKEQILLDRDVCIGAGMCEAVSPSAFRVDDDGLVEITPELAQADAGLLEPEFAEAVTKAIAVCPARAILLDVPARSGGNDA